MPAKVNFPHGKNVFACIASEQLLLPPVIRQRMNIKFIEHFGKFLVWMKLVFSKPEKFSMYWKETMRQMNDIGIGSLIIVMLISTFMGAVMAVQISYQLSGQLIPRYYVGYLVREINII